MVVYFLEFMILLLIISKWKQYGGAISRLFLLFNFGYNGGKWNHKKFINLFLSYVDLIFLFRRYQ